MGIFAPSYPLVAHVLAFGADPTGAAFSTVAIQAALNSLATSGGIVFLDPGRYKLTNATPLSVPTGVSLIGINESYGGATVPTEDCVLDASAWADGVWPNDRILTTVGNGHNNRFENFEILGPAEATLVHKDGLDGIHGIFIGTTGWVVRNVTVRGGTHGLTCYYANRGTFDRLYCVNQKTHGLNLIQAHNILSTNSLYSNAGGATAHLGAANIYLEDCTCCTFLDPLIDETSGGNACVLVASGSDIDFYTRQIYTSVGGYGLRLGNGTTNPDRVRLMNCRVSKFAGGTNPINTISIGGGSGHALVNVVTVPAGGGDITDAGTDTMYFNVNGKHRLRLVSYANNAAAAVALPVGALYAITGTDPLQVAQVY